MRRFNNDRVITMDRRQRKREQAMEMLAADFRQAMLQGPSALVATPYGASEQRTVLELIHLQLGARRDDRAIERMISVCANAARHGDQDASDLIDQLALAHATSYALLMKQAGEFA